MTPIRTHPRKKPLLPQQKTYPQKTDLGVASKDFLEESVGFIPEDDIITFTGP